MPNGASARRRPCSMARPALPRLFHRAPALRRADRILGRPADRADHRHRVSSRIISTDVPLLFFWSLALLAYVHLLIAPRKRWAIVLGLSIGLGLLSKYAMIYLVPGMLLAALASRRAREVLGEPHICGLACRSARSWWRRMSPGTSATRS